jgi:hypothetical protein
MLRSHSKVDTLEETTEKACRLQTAFKIVQLQRWELEPKPLTEAQFLLLAVSIDNVLVVPNERIWCLLRPKRCPMLKGEKGEV